VGHCSSRCQRPIGIMGRQLSARTGDRRDCTAARRSTYGICAAIRQSWAIRYLRADVKGLAKCRVPKVTPSKWRTRVTVHQGGAPARSPLYTLVFPGDPGFLFTASRMVSLDLHFRFLRRDLVSPSLHVTSPSAPERFISGDGPRSHHASRRGTSVSFRR